MNEHTRAFSASTAVRPWYAPKPLPPQDELRRIFDFDPGTGDLIWKYRAESPPSWNAKHVGRLAGSPTNTQHFQVRISSVNYLAHRIVWKWLHGTEPPEVDHRDGNGFNNRPGNLRAACRSENCCNTRRRSHKSLPKGVFQYGGARPFAQIRKDGQAIYLGTFDTVEEASEAYQRAATKLHRDFARFD